MVSYNPKVIEKKWQTIWDKEKAFATPDDFSRPKYYALIEFPYPSGAGLHVGHPRPYTALDIVARKRRMEGYNVLYPMGWDAFGLPTENYAIKNHIHPRLVTERNVRHFTDQLKMLGYSFDWEREVNTTDPAYYHWTQWIFLKMFKKGLAYKTKMPINWCPSCKVGLANEEVVDGCCERCGTPIYRKQQTQWMLKITAYAEELLNGLNEVDYPERVKASQRNWIGRSEGAEVDFAISGTEDKIRVFTTRPDTLFGATYMVLSPEHPYIDKYADRLANRAEVEAYRKEAAKKSDFERAELVKDKTGVELKGIRAVNPVTGNEIPVWISDYVLMTYGTGAIMAVPAHDERDWDFAKTFGLPIVEVVAGGNVEEAAYTDVQKGKLVNSGFLNGLEVAEAKKRIIEYLKEKKLGSAKVNYKLRDWVFSRQRYWGEPIPIVYCEKCGYVPLSEEELPLLLPEVESYEPTDDGSSPLAKISDWVNTTCPCCGGPALRETDTMPQWAGSSWYYLRYIDPHNPDCLADPEKLKYWLPVDWYNGGMEHTTLHLLYSRFWHHFLYDEKQVPVPEPYKKRTSHGLILGSDGEKMSKSRGNVVNPDELVDEVGADALRTYEMFIGAFEQHAAWSTEGLRGCRRFLERVWKLQEMLTDGESYSADLETKMHQAIKKVSSDYENLKYNTAISTLMALVNDFYRLGRVTRAEWKTFLLLLNPVAPHITEELWELSAFNGRCYEQSWPVYEEAKTLEEEAEIAVQVNGKMRGTIRISRQADKEAVSLAAQEMLKGKLSGTIVKEIFVPGRIINFVIKA